LVLMHFQNLNSDLIYSKSMQVSITYEVDEN
jgi:hypothetical protein